MHSIARPTISARSLKLLLVVALPLVLILGPLRLLVTPEYLTFEYSKGDFPPDPFGFDQVQRLTYASANVQYLREAQPLDALAAQRLGQAPAYNARELKHMQDVQNVYQAAWEVWQMALIVSVLAGLALARRAETRPDLALAIRWGGVLTAGLVAVVSLLAILAWQSWFVAFHQVFFTPGTWTFEWSDTLIRLFPNKFWFDAALTLSGLSLLSGLLLALIGWRLQPKRPAGRVSRLPSSVQPQAYY